MLGGLGEGGHRSPARCAWSGRRRRAGRGRTRLPGRDAGRAARGRRTGPARRWPPRRAPGCGGRMRRASWCRARASSAVVRPGPGCGRSSAGSSGRPTCSAKVPSRRRVTAFGGWPVRRACRPAGRWARAGPRGRPAVRARRGEPVPGGGRPRGRCGVGGGCAVVGRGRFEGRTSSASASLSAPVSFSVSVVRAGRGCAGRGPAPVRGGRCPGRRGGPSTRRARPLRRPPASARRTVPARPAAGSGRSPLGPGQR